MNGKKKQPAPPAAAEALRFAEAIEAAHTHEAARGGIGTLGEKTLHAVLKYYLEPDDAFHEVKCGRYVADILRDGRITEIQTRSFDHLRAKLAAFLPDYDVTVVYPLAKVKFVRWIDPADGSVSPPRRSPKSWTVHEAFWELNKIRAYLKDPHLHIRFLFLELTEYRTLDGWSHDKKRGSTRFDREPAAVLDDLTIRRAGDFTSLIPQTLVSPFTAKDYAKEAHVDISRARQAISLLVYLGLLRETGKSGRSKLYSFSDKE